MTSRSAFIVFLLLGFAVPGVAQESEPARFLIESIVVEGVQRDAAREIVTAESLLVPGRDYTEQQLREAVYRIKRLPFVLDATFALRKGAERGSYQLVVTIEATRPFFYSVTAGGLYSGDAGAGDDVWDLGASVSAGGRWFVGSQGLVFGSVEGFDGGGAQRAQAGYTRYNLFGRGGFASLVLGSNVNTRSSQGTYRTGALSVGIPLAGNHSLRADLGWARSDREGAAFSQEATSSSGALEWVFDTTDDPLFPTSGLRVTGAGFLSRLDTSFRSGTFSGRDEEDGHGLALEGRRYRVLTPRQSVGAELTAGWTRQTSSFGSGRQRQTQESAGLGFSHSMDLWGFEKTERIGDLRWESRLLVSSGRFTSSFGRSTGTLAELSTGVAFRNAWGLTRFTFTYFDNLQQDFQP